MLRIIEKTRLWFTISLIIIVAGIVMMAAKGLEFGIDFKGGTVVQIDMGKDFNKADADAIVSKYAKDAVTNRASSTDATYQYEVKSADLTRDNISKMVADLTTKFNLKQNPVLNSETIGASIGQELKTKALWALALATVLMLLYIGFRFEFKFGAAAILSLLHDVLVTLSVYAIFRVPIDSGFIAAMLTVIGYSINDTIVVFDRIRENQKYMRKSDVTELANSSVTQTMSRSINTVMTVVITITAVYFCVPSVRNFAFPLVIGIVSGCYSSIFIASPFWVIFKNRSKKKAVSTAKAK